MMNKEKKENLRRVMADKRMQRLEKDGMLNRIGRVMCAGYMLQQMANTLFYDTQDLLETHGFIHGELKRVWKNAEAANDRLARTFVRLFMDSYNKEAFIDDVTRTFPPILSTLGLSEDIERITGKKPIDINGPRELTDLGADCKITFKTHTALRDTINLMARINGIPQKEVLNRWLYNVCETFLRERKAEIEERTAHGLQCDAEPIQPTAQP